MLVEPSVQIEVVILFGPEHAGESLPVNAPLVLREVLRRDPVVKLIRFGLPLVKIRFKSIERVGNGLRPEPQAHCLRTSRRYLKNVVRRRFRSDPRRIHRLAPAGNQVLVNGVLYVRGRIRLAPQPGRVRFVFREQQLRLALAIQEAIPKLRMRSANDTSWQLAESRLD